MEKITRRHALTRIIGLSAAVVGGYKRISAEMERRTGKPGNLLSNGSAFIKPGRRSSKKTANALSGGSGWTIPAYNLQTKVLHNYWAADHTSNAPFSVPLLVLDMYEHAYHMDYGAAAAKYIDAFMTNVNWDAVNRRLGEIRMI